MAYAPKEFRAEFRWLIAFDRKLREVLARASEPMIAELRLAWWRDALQKPVPDRPKGEPLLAGLDGLDGEVAKLAVAMVDGYEGMIDAPGEGTQPPLFAAYQGLTGMAAVELALPASPRKLRSLSILALARQLEQKGGRANGLRLSWHALTGR